MYLPRQYGFQLPKFEITYEQQLALVSHTKAMYLQGRIEGTSYSSLPETKPFVYSLAMRKASIGGQKVKSNMLVRYDYERNWEWDYADICKPITDIVKDIVGPLIPYYQFFTRCVVLLQIENEFLPLHVDYHDHNELGHINNRNLAIKIPLTEIEGDNGDPLIEIDGVTYLYHTGKTPFLLNEVEVKHGSAKVSHTRGVLFLDGLIDYERIDNELQKQPIEITKLIVKE